MCHVVVVVEIRCQSESAVVDDVVQQYAGLVKLLLVHMSMGLNGFCGKFISASGLA